MSSMSEQDTTEIIRAFLETQSTLALATVNTEGQPQVAPLFFVADDRLNMYWLSSPQSQHSVNVVAHKRVYATVYPSVWQWSDIVGLQIEGTAEAINDDRMREQIMNLYLRKFQLPTEFDSLIASATLYRLTPTWMRWMDNSVSFNFKAEVNL
jgi:uncharacterized protein YhbP (UPF0306 family)